MAVFSRDHMYIKQKRFLTYKVAGMILCSLTHSFWNLFELYWGNQLEQ